MISILNIAFKMFGLTDFYDACTIYVSSAISYTLSVCRMMRTLNCPFKAKKSWGKQARDSIWNDQKHTILSYNNITTHSINFWIYQWIASPMLSTFQHSCSMKMHKNWSPEVACFCIICKWLMKSFNEHKQYTILSKLKWNKLSTQQTMLP